MASQDELDAKAAEVRAQLADWNTALYERIAPSDGLFEQFMQLSVEDRASVKIDAGMVARMRTAFAVVIERRAQTHSEVKQKASATKVARHILDTFFGRILVATTATCDVRTVQSGAGPSENGVYKNGAPVVRGEALYTKFVVDFSLGDDVTEKTDREAERVRLRALGFDENAELAEPEPRKHRIEFEGSVGVLRTDDGEIDGYQFLHARAKEDLIAGKVMPPQTIKMLFDDLLRAFNVPPDAITELNQRRTQWEHCKQ
jgi:hypothetical protein